MGNDSRAPGGVAFHRSPPSLSASRKGAAHVPGRRSQADSRRATDVNRRAPLRVADDGRWVKNCCPLMGFVFPGSGNPNHMRTSSLMRRADQAMFIITATPSRLMTLPLMSVPA